jgi:hypothetical protein
MVALQKEELVLMLIIEHATQVKVAAEFDLLRTLAVVTHRLALNASPFITVEISVLQSAANASHVIRPRTRARQSEWTGCIW